VCVGQQTKQVVSCAGSEDGHYVPIEPPLTFVTGPSLKCDPKLEYNAFDGHGKEFCAPLLHAVTEKEWQELMARLKKLEREK